jgi:pyridoxine kinase
MPLALVIGSHVAASRVGGTITSLALALSPAEVDPIHIPTTLLGRHPGWGKPGGGLVAASTMMGMLEGVEANGLFALCDAVLTGYLASPDQAAVATRAIEKVRAANPRALVLVDPVMGDDPSGLYVSEDIAAAIQRELVPLADVITPNLFELGRLAGQPITRLEEARAAAGALGCTVILTSAPAPAGEVAAALFTSEGAWVCRHPRRETAVKGTGDLVSAAFVARRLEGLNPPEAFASAMAVTAHVIDSALAWSAPELPIVGDREAWAAPPLTLEPL